MQPSLASGDGRVPRAFRSAWRNSGLRESLAPEQDVVSKRRLLTPALASTEVHRFTYPDNRVRACVRLWKDFHGMQAYWFQLTSSSWVRTKREDLRVKGLAVVTQTVPFCGEDHQRYALADSEELLVHVRPHCYTLMFVAEGRARLRAALIAVEATPEPRLAFRFSSGVCLRAGVCDTHAHTDKHRGRKRKVLPSQTAGLHVRNVSQRRESATS